METSTLASRITSRLSELGMTQAELARRCGVERSAVNQWVNGKVPNIRPDNLICVADTLGLEIRWLATGRGQRLARQDPPMNYDDADRVLLESPPELKRIFRQIIETTQNKAD